jgi:hypothetical protein
MFAGFKNLKTHPKIKKTANSKGGQQPHPANKISRQKNISRFLSLYQRLLFASIPFIKN